MFTPAVAAQFFQSLGLPGFLAYVIIAGELAVGAGLFLGVLTRARGAGRHGDHRSAPSSRCTARKAGSSPTRTAAGSSPPFGRRRSLVQALLGDGAWALGPALGIDCAVSKTGMIGRLNHVAIAVPDVKAAAKAL